MESICCSASLSNDEGRNNTFTFLYLCGKVNLSIVVCTAPRFTLPSLSSSCKSSCKQQACLSDFESICGHVQICHSHSTIVRHLNSFLFQDTGKKLGWRLNVSLHTTIINQARLVGVSGRREEIETHTPHSSPERRTRGGMG